MLNLYSSIFRPKIRKKRAKKETVESPTSPPPPTSSPPPLPTPPPPGESRRVGYFRWHQGRAQEFLKGWETETVRGGELLTSGTCLIRQIDYLKDHEAPIADCCEITINDINFTKIRKILLAFLSFFYLKVIVSFYNSVAVVCPPFFGDTGGLKTK